MEEIQIPLTCYRGALIDLDDIRHGTDGSEVLRWLKVVRNITVSDGSARDFDDDHLIAEDQRTVLQLSVPMLFDRVLIPLALSPRSK